MTLDASVVRRCRYVTRVAGVFVAAVGALGLIGWVTGIESLKAAFTGPITIKANAAVCLVLLGVATLLFAPPAGGSPRRWAAPWPWWRWPSRA